MILNRTWKLSAVIVIMALTAACDKIPIPILTFATAGPSPTPGPVGPTPTPLPASLVSFRVRVPANTPPGSAPAIRLLDEVGGTSIIVPLISEGNQVWSGGTQAAGGSVLRYRYIRSLPTYVEEVTPARQPVDFRLLLVSREAATVEDTVAAWSDTPFAGDLGRVVGTVRNVNTGRGQRDVWVAAGGQRVQTAWDGSYALVDLPVGNQRVTVMAPDGSLRPTHRDVLVLAGQTLVVDLASDDPNQVHVTFNVRLPGGTDPSAAVRVVGNVSQLGNTFVLNEASAAIAAARAPVLVPLGDGRWSATVVLYEGTVLRYKYTLGDGVWNGELDGQGARRLRQVIVPLSDLTLADQVETWHLGGSAGVTFELTTPPNTPANDVLAIQLRTDHWHAPLPMWRVGLNQWKFVLSNPTDHAGSVFYRYCRNLECGTADDAATAGRNASGRVFTFTLFPQDLHDRVNGWEWLADSAPPSAALPQVNFHPGFAAGIDLLDEWEPDDLPFYGEAFRGVHATGANWVTLTRRGHALRMVPLPAYGDDPALSPTATDWNSLVAQAHNSGLRIALRPVTCHYTPYGACEYWNGAPYSADFWNAWFAAYEKYLLTQADLAARSATDVLIIGDFKLRPSFPGEPEAAPDAEPRWRNLINAVRSQFKGQLAFELLMGEAVWPNPPAFLDAVDVIRVFWWSPLAPAGSVTPAVPDMAAAAAGLMDAHLLPLAQRFRKPVHISAAYYAANGAATQCLRRDDGQCHLFEDLNPGGVDVIKYGLDLQEQASIYHALLTAVNDRAWVSGFSSYGYNPAVTLRDKSISVRGKPAEAVLAAWYPKLLGR